MLSDAIILVLALTLIVVGVQNMLDPQRRQVASEAIKSTLMVIAGLYFVYYWYAGVAAGKTSSGGYGYGPYGQ